MFKSHTKQIKSLFLEKHVTKIISQTREMVKKQTKKPIMLIIFKESEKLLKYLPQIFQVQNCLSTFKGHIIPSVS